MQSNVGSVDGGDEAREEAEIRTHDEGGRVPQKVGVWFTCVCVHILTDSTKHRVRVCINSVCLFLILSSHYS